MSDRFTFKKEKRETGRYGVGHPYQSVTIKHDKQWVGTIHAPNWHATHWRVMLMFDGNAGNPNCNWHWEDVGVFKTDEEARAFLQANAKKYITQGLRHCDTEQ